MGFLTGVDDSVPRTAYTVPEAARSLGISVSSLRRQIRAGNLLCVRIGNLVRVPAWVLEE
jgi:excisionase family DNA binding protein